MRFSGTAVATLALALLCGCNGGDGGKGLDLRPAGVSPAYIARSIADDCKTRVVRRAFPGDPGHARFRQLADRALVIRCAGSRGRDLSAYAEFESHARLRAALHTIVLPPAGVEQFCIVDRIAFTTDFWGAVSPVCRRAGGRLRNLRRPPRPSAVSGRTYALNCGNAFFLEFRRPAWSSGCTGGSENVRRIAWRHWGRRSASGKGIALERWDACRNCSDWKTYHAAARIRLDTARECTDQGATLRYFERARVMVHMRPGNPFGYAPGWRESVYRERSRRCSLYREDPLSGHSISG